MAAPDGTFQGKLDATGTVRAISRRPVRAAGDFESALEAAAARNGLVVTQDATQFGNHCPQAITPFGNATLTEDCLFLNVCAPNGRGGHDFDRSDGPNLAAKTGAR